MSREKRKNRTLATGASAPRVNRTKAKRPIKVAAIEPQNAESRKGSAFCFCYSHNKVLCRAFYERKRAYSFVSPVSQSFFFLQSYGQEEQPQEQDPPRRRARRVKKTASATATTRTATTITEARFACNHANIYNTPPKGSVSRCTSAATTHATAHWIATTRAAQRTPSSRRIDPIAATQGV